MNQPRLIEYCQAAKDTIGGTESNPASEKSATINYQDFEKLDLRIARITNAETVDGADKLLRLSLDDSTGICTVLAGIKSSYTPAALIGRHVGFRQKLNPKKDPLRRFIRHGAGRRQRTTVPDQP